MNTLYISILLSFFIPTQESDRSISIDNNPVELGKVNWIRNYDSGIQKAKSEDKPVFLLFQEVPGCATCQNYGKDVLSHPLIVEAIETLFVPVAVFNNKGGQDAKILQKFNEPSWNNPVVRIVDGQQKNIVPRVSGNYSKLGIVQAMILALYHQEKAIPTWLELLQQELKAQQYGTETATLSMYCFWTGEKQLGKINGVVSTQPGFMNGREVVQVEFDPAKVNYETIVKSGKKDHVADLIFTHDDDQSKALNKLGDQIAQSPKQNFRLDHTPKYYLSKTSYQYVPMTTIQATKANSLIGQGLSPDKVFSEKQLEILNYIKQNQGKKWKNLIGVPIEKGWNTYESAL